MVRNLQLTGVFLLTAGLLAAQNMTEYGAAMAGASVGGASGKAVSSGISTIFGKMDDQTVKAAGKEENKALGKEENKVKPSATQTTIATTTTGQPAAVYSADPGVPGAPRRAATKKAKAASASTVNEDTSVPPPPPLAERASVRKPVSGTDALHAPPPVPFAPFTLADAVPATPIPPPPTMTPEAFRKIAAGMSRREVLILGEPSSRISMFEDGHMVEMFSYRASGQPFGHLRLEDGTVVRAEAK